MVAVVARSFTDAVRGCLRRHLGRCSTAPFSFANRRDVLFVGVRLAPCLDWRGGLDFALLLFTISVVQAGPEGFSKQSGECLNPPAFPKIKHGHPLTNTFPRWRFG